MKIILEKSFILFIVTYVFGLIASIAWLNFAESWSIFGDAIHYVSIYKGELAPAPWGYRVFTPYFASLLPWDMTTNFTVLSLNSIALTTGVLALYGKKNDFTLIGISLLVIFWMASYPFAYYSSAIVRADAPMLLMLAVIFLLSKYKVSPFVLLMLSLLGTFFHEMILISIPALWLDKVFKGSLTGGAKYNYFSLVLISIFPLISLIIFRGFVIEVMPVLNLNMPVISILDYTGGGIKHALRIYAAYGPVLLFCLFFILKKRLQSISYPFFGLMLVTVLATFFAADTLRVMSILYIPVLFYGTKYLLIYLKNENFNIFLFLIIFQIVYSFIVFANLRSFESSMFLNLSAAFISLVTMIFCLLIFRIKLLE